MHEAFKAIPIYERMPMSIECIAICDHEGKKTSEDGKPNMIAKVLIGNKDGHLLIFQVNANIQYARGVETILLNTFRAFSKKPILQLYATDELNIIISLSEGIISVHTLDSKCNLINILSRTKGATNFSADLESQLSSTGAAAHALKLCVVVRRSLQFYFWKNGEFCQLHADVVLPEAPKSLAWCRDSICVGLKREYLLVKLNDENPVRDLSPTGKSSEPVMGLVKENMMALQKDEDTVFINSNGEFTYKFSFSWSEIPIALCSQPPYLLAVMGKYIEVRTMDPRLLIQNIDLPKPKVIKRNKNWIVVASTNSIWMLQQLPFSKQRTTLLNSREYELALQLAKLSVEDTEEEKEKMIQDIEILLAFDMFRQKRFEKSLNSFADLCVDPSQVIGLFPDLLPEKQSNRIEYPAAVPRLKGSDLEEGLIALSEYLTLKRNEMLKVTTSTVHNLKPIVAKNSVIRSRKSLLQIIDTTLLKCYLKTNNALVGPLLRLPENYCHLEEAERMLKKMSKNRELTELYKRRGLHRKALDLLLAQYQERGSTGELVEYLQHLGNGHLELVFHFASELLDANPKEGLKVFTGDTAEVESLPRRQVFDFLDLKAKQLVKPYLEHLIFGLEDATETFHNQLALIYKDHVMRLLRDLNAARPEDVIIVVDDDLGMDEESAEFVQAKSKLQSFLEVSTNYEPQLLLAEFPDDILLEERAVILGRQGSHEQALAIYIYSLQDPQKAESYCERVYDESPEQNKDVFLSLLRMYLQVGASPACESKNLDVALGILHKHSNKIDPLQALMLLPGSIPIGSIQEFVCRTLENQNRQRNQLKVLNSLLISESLQVHERRIHYDNISCCVTEDRTCCVCKKKIGDSAFARYPNDVIVHYFCCKDRKVLPQTS